MSEINRKKGKKKKKNGSHREISKRRKMENLQKPPSKEGRRKIRKKGILGIKRIT